MSGLQAVVGRGERLLLVIGDAGVGKTRFVSEGMRRAAVSGVVSVWGGCLPVRETLPLLPVADALGELSRVDRGELLESAWMTILSPKTFRTSGINLSVRPGIASRLRLMRPPTRNLSAFAPVGSTSVFK